MAAHRREGGDRLLGPDGWLGRLDDPGLWLDSVLARFMDGPVGDALLLGIGAWVVVCIALCAMGAPDAAIRANLRLAGWALSGAAALAWLPIAGALRLTGRSVPLVGFGLISLLPGSAPRVSEPETAELQKRRKADPRKAPGTRQLSHGQVWTPAGAREAVSAAIVAESGAAKGQTYVNYVIQHQLQHSPEHLILLEVKPNLELSNVVYAHARERDRIFEYSMQDKDELSSAAALISDPRTLPDVCWSLSHEPDARDSHWNEKAAEAMEQVALGYLHFEVEPTMNGVRDVIADRERLSDLRRPYPPLDYVADEPKEWGYIRSTAAKRLKPLSDPLIRRVFAGGTGSPQPDFSRTDGREVVIVRPDWSSAERTSRFVTALIHALVMSAVRGGYAGGPGTKAVLDEAGSFMRLSRLGGYLDLARGGRINVVYVLQSRAQLAAQLGRDEAERVWSATELKVVGPTSDLPLARDIAALSGERRVHYLVRPEEITGQREGEFTMVHRGQVLKYAVPRRRYHHTQAARPPARRPRPAGVADPASYAVPEMIRPDGGDDPGPEPTEEDDILD